MLLFLGIHGILYFNINIIINHLKVITLSFAMDVFKYIASKYNDLFLMLQDIRQTFILFYCVTLLKIV